MAQATGGELSYPKVLSDVALTRLTPPDTSIPVGGIAYRFQNGGSDEMVIVKRVGASAPVAITLAAAKALPGFCLVLQAGQNDYLRAPSGGYPDFLRGDDLYAIAGVNTEVLLVCPVNGDFSL